MEIRQLKKKNNKKNNLIIVDKVFALGRGGCIEMSVFCEIELEMIIFFPHHKSRMINNGMLLQEKTTKKK